MCVCLYKCMHAYLYIRRIIQVIHIFLLTYITIYSVCAADVPLNDAAQSTRTLIRRAPPPPPAAATGEAAANLPLMEGRGFYSRGKWDAGRLYGIFMSLSRGWIPRRGDALPRDGLSCLGILSFGGRRGFIYAFSGKGAARPGKRHGMKPISSGQGLHAPSATIWKVCILMPCYRLYIRGDATTFHIIIIIKRERSVTSTTAPSIHNGSCPRARARRNSHRPPFATVPAPLFAPHKRVAPAHPVGGRSHKLHTQLYLDGSCAPRALVIYDFQRFIRAPRQPLRRAAIVHGEEKRDLWCQHAGADAAQITKRYNST